MRRKKHAAGDDDAAIDMTPMLDIVFIMLIFFIVTTSFVKERGIEVLRPKENNTPPPQTNVKNLGLKIDANGIITMEGREVDIRRVVARVQNFLANNNTDSAAVQAHPKAKHGVVIEVVNQIKIAGVDKVSVMKTDS